MWCVVLWQPSADVHDEVMEWFINEFTPGMLDSPELLRTRLFKLDNVSHIRGQKQEQVDKDSLLQYMTLWEFETEEFPWEILVYLGSSDKWRLYVEDGKFVCCRPPRIWKIRLTCMHSIGRLDNIW